MNSFDEMMLAEGFERVAMGRTEHFLQPKGARYQKIFRGTITEVCFYPDQEKKRLKLGTEELKRR